MTSIDEDDLLLKYFRRRHLEPSTQKSYTNILRNYYKATGLTPTKAITEADAEEEEGIRLIRRKIKDHLEDFEDYLENGEYSELNLRNSIATIRAFYTFYGIELPKTTRRPPNPEPEQTLEDLPGADDIRKAISHASIKYQAMIVLMASSGMRQGDCRGLTLKNFVDTISEYADIGMNDLTDVTYVREMLPDTVGPLTWNIWMQKRKRYYTCFSTPESLDFILSYLDYKPPVNLDPETFLFRNPREDYMKRKSFNGYFKLLDQKCQFPERKGFIYFRPHNLRKWFGNQLKKTELGYTKTEILMGHQIQDDTGRRYLKHDYAHLRKLYYKNMDNLTLFGKVEVHDLTEEKVKLLEARDIQREKDIQFMMDMLKNNPYLETLKDPEAQALLDKYTQKKKGKK